jgi:Glycosyl hydrolase family 12
VKLCPIQSTYQDTKAPRQVLILKGGSPLWKLIVCALAVAMLPLAISGSGASSAPITSAIPTHQCNGWNYTSHAHDGEHAYGQRYVVKNNVWNPEKISQTLYSCNFDSFYVEANVHDRAGAVQSYPSSQYTFASPIAISKLSSLTSDFRVTDPPTGSGLDYEFAYDIWIDGYGGNDHTELMVWTYTRGQRPAGSELPGTVVFDGRGYKVWKGGTLRDGGDVVTFEATKNLTASDTNLVPFLDYAAAHGWLHRGKSAPLWQIDYGAEVCATPKPMKFDFTDFSVTYGT